MEAGQATTWTLEAGDHEGQRHVRVLVEPGVDAPRVRLERRPARVGHDGDVGLGRVTPAEGSDVAVVVERGVAEELRQPPGADPPPDLHLPHSLRRLDVALGSEQILCGRGVDAGNAEL